MIRLKISFDGSEFLGWQNQKDFSPTIQGTLNNALKKIYKQDISTIGSGRTDAGVHAKDLYVAFSAPFEIPLDSLVKALNSHLPDSIRALEAIFVNDQFRPTFDARYKEYRYYFTNMKIPSAHFSKYMSNISYELDFKLMTKACSLFVGEHDFQDFHCKGSDPASTIRMIYKCKLIEESGSFGGILPDHYYLQVIGSGFLKQMVRLIMGTVWNVGRGKVGLRDIAEHLHSPTGKHLAPVAPPNGLFKYAVEYDKPFDNLSV